MEFWSKRKVFMAWKRDGQAARAFLSIATTGSCVKWRARKAKKSGKSEVDVDEFGSTLSMSETVVEDSGKVGACKGARKCLRLRIQPAAIMEFVRRDEE